MFNVSMHIKPIKTTGKLQERNIQHTTFGSMCNIKYFHYWEHVQYKILSIITLFTNTGHW